MGDRARWVDHVGVNEFERLAARAEALGAEPIDPNDGAMCYMVPVGRGYRREYQDMQRSFTCCVGTGMENVVAKDGLAIIVNRKLRGIHIYRALYFVPAVSGSIAIGLSWRWLFDRNGFLNGFLVWLGAIDEPIQWLTDPDFVLPIASSCSTLLAPASSSSMRACISRARRP